MLEINERIRIPDDEFTWTFARSGGPGGQNVNKVASKAVLHWDLAGSPSVPEEVKARFRTLYRRRLTVEGILVLTCQEYRDQDRNRQACLEKLREFLVLAAHRPRVRKATRPTRGSKERRLQAKKRRSTLKGGRRDSVED